MTSLLSSPSWRAVAEDEAGGRGSLLGRWRFLLGLHNAYASASADADAYASASAST